MKAPKSEGGNYEKHPVGWTALVCTRIIDTGTHFNPAKQKDDHRIMIGFESSKLMEEGEFKGEPFLIFAHYNYSMYQNSHLCRFAESWQGKKFATQEIADDFDLSILLGKAAYGNITHSEDGKYTNIGAIGPIPDGMTAPEAKGKIILIDQENLERDMVALLSDKMKEKVLGAKEQAQPSLSNQGSHSYDAKYDEGNPPPPNEEPAF